ncbi:MAG: L,D-transpeptidase [Candidatus Nanopelagicales bacterium]|nr:L,D-transpeptidase [Candidatus Nanopelagicales bacterium]
MRGSLRVLVSAGLSVLLGSALWPAQANAVEGPPAPPTIISVSPGVTARTLDVVYSAQAPDPVQSASDPISYQISLNSVKWYACQELAAPENAVAGNPVQGICPLSNLDPLRTYGVYMRAARGASASEVVGPIVATTQPPAGTEAAKPEELPKKRIWVKAKFIAASNSLGVDGSKVKVGVGVLPKIVFSKPIPDKIVVEKNLVVSAELPSGKIVPVKGAWGWLDETSAVFRPKTYWPGKSTIRVVSLLGRTVLGRSGSKSLIGSAKLDTTYTLETARKLIARVDGKTKKMKVYVDGNNVKTFKVSLGKDDWETRNGTKVISTAKEASKIYRSESLGLTDPEEQYELEGFWNTRLTPTGEFLHSAPWAYGRLGIYNGSHGCTNMYVHDAKWIFNETIPGDVVLYTNTNGNVNEPWNGPGGLWNIEWKKWLKKSALSNGNQKVDTDTNTGTGSITDAKPASV